MRTRPDKIFVSVDESTGKSIISFQPQDAGDAISYEDDKAGTLAMKTAQSIVDKYPGTPIHGPHFHAARPANARMRRKAPRAS
ncbi:MAG TPA: hypothetical protein VK427_26305 [Kofleriaceae bacterium]|nr:hypothetical protein [Kofleriaceae bacterium]